MKKLIVTTIFLLSISYAFTQQSEKNSASFNLGEGISFSFNEGKYEFDIFGFIRPSYIYSDEKIYTSEGSYSNVYRQFKSQNSNLYFTGAAIDEKLSFTIQMDYSSSDPLVEAFIGYHINEKTTLYFGQMQVSHNNLEMVHNENDLRFTSRGLISQTYTENGEEFGLFLETSFGNSFLVEPTLAITSGDGKNSFGEDSRDSDKGGVKFGSRINILPFFGPSYTGSMTLNQWAAYSGSAQTPANTSTWYTTNDATFEITGVQLEVGDTATSFEHRSFADEIQRCYRYYWQSNGQLAAAQPQYMIYGEFINKSTTVADFSYRYAVRMRAAPTVATSGTFKFDSQTTVTLTGLAVLYGTEISSQLRGTTGGSLNASGGIGYSLLTTTNTDFLSFSAEL